MEAHHQLSASLDMRTPKYPELQLTGKISGKMPAKCQDPMGPAPELQVWGGCGRRAGGARSVGSGVEEAYAANSLL